MIISRLKTSQKFLANENTRFFLKNFQVKHFLWGLSFPWPPIFHEFIQKIKKYRIYAFRIGKVKTNPKPTTYDF